MTKLKLTGFTNADDVDYDPIEFDVEWRDAETGEYGGLEKFQARPRVPIGVLFALESGQDSAAMELIEKALMKKDGAINNNTGRIDETTSSFARWRNLVNDEDRIVPGQLISEVLRGLFVEYTNRRAPSGAPERPTKLDEQSSKASSPTGSGSTGRQRGKASTSSASRPTAD